MKIQDAMLLLLYRFPKLGSALLVSSTDEEQIALAKLCEPLPEGKKLVTNIMTGALVLEDKDTPYACSVASEAYWCS